MDRGIFLSTSRALDIDFITGILMDFMRMEKFMTLLSSLEKIIFFEIFMSFLN